MEYRRKLLKDEVALFPPELVHIFELFSDAGKEIYLVGGGVRNILSGKRPVNCDLTTNATPEEIQEITKEYNPYYENDFGTVGIVVGEEVYEITTYRSEKGYSDFRHPDKVIWGKTLEEDVTRREFTISAVVMSKDELVDLVEGLSDFEEGIIRTVGNPEERFGEDALRMMRAIRLAATLSFRIEDKTLAAISKRAPLLSKISRERVRDELLKILGSDYPADGIRLLISTGLMEFIIPEVLAGRGVDQKGHHTLDVLDHMLESLAGCPSRNPIVRLATFLHDIGKPATRRFHCAKCGKLIKETEKRVDGQLVCPNCQTRQTEREATTFYGHEVVGERMVAKIADDLRLMNKDKDKIKTLVRWHMFAYQPEMTDASIRRFIRRVGKENINDMILLRIGDRKGGGSKTTSWRLMELQKRIGEQLYEPMEI
ncbi:HD domain-containing protein, partial [Candidatus Collierbacteria bacterium]|nr:HD domain-containing protein [Candidatus Collierbacteria bacterium]